MTHEGLIDSLVEHLEVSGRVAIPNVPLGSSWLREERRGIVDVLAFNTSYRQHNSTVYEIKATRADLFGDINSGKYEKYLKFTARFCFAFEKGLAKKDEIPTRCGIITYNSDKESWHNLRASARTPDDEIEFDFETMLAVLFNMKKRVDKHEERLASMRHIANRGLAPSSVYRIAGAKIADILNNDNGLLNQAAIEVIHNMHKAFGMKPEKDYNGNIKTWELVATSRQFRATAAAVKAFDIEMKVEDFDER